MKRLYYFPLSLLCFLFLQLNNANAYHNMGGEISWECLPNGQYIFKMNLYRICAGASFNFVNQTINYQGGNITVKPDSNRWLTYNQNGQFNHKGIDGCQLDCATNPAAVTFYPFISDPVTINAVPPPGGLVFSWGPICCRAPSADNLSAPATESVYLRAVMYNFNNQNLSNCYDSSPQFGELPVFPVCYDMEFIYNPNGYDKDLDSLVYEWAEPMHSSTVAVSFKNPYSYSNPFPDTSINSSNIPVSLDATTGTYSFKTVGSMSHVQYIKCFKIDAYREGIKIASVYRDVPLMLVNCPDLNSNVPNNLPSVTVNGISAEDFVDTVIAGQQISLQIQANESDIVYSDPNDPTSAHLQKIAISPRSFLFSNDFTDSLSCKTQGISPCATLSPAPVLNSLNGELELSGNGTVTATLEWQTDCVHLGSNSAAPSNYKSYNFVLKTYDDHCDIPALSYPTLKIVVARYIPEIQQNGNVLSVDPAESYQWYFNGVPIPNSDTSAITITALGKYSVEVVKYGCDSRRAHYQVQSVSLEENDWRNEVSVYPNPFKDGFVVELPSTSLASMEFQLFDMQGKEVEINFRKNSNRILIDATKTIKQGVYLLEVSSENQKVMKKIVKL